MFTSHFRKLRRSLLQAEVNILLRTRGAGIYQPVPWVGIQETKRSESTWQRWRAIANELGSATGSVLDIGCDLGFFSFQLAERGSFCIGVESEALPYHICNLIREIGEFNNVVFLRAFVDEKFSRILPTVDVTLILSVFHHIVRQSGLNAATRLMVELMGRTRRVMFFETGQSNELNASWTRDLPQMSPSPREWITNYLFSLGASKVKHLGEYETHLSAVRRSLFAVYLD